MMAKLEIIYITPIITIWFMNVNMILTTVVFYILQTTWALNQ